MFKKLMWATDGSQAADLALPLVRTLAGEHDGEVLVAHCEEMMVIAGRGGGVFPVHADEDDLRAKIERQVKELSAAGIRTTFRTLHSRAGGAAHALAELAAEEAVDVIIVGTRGHTPLGGLLLGSVTQRLLQLAPCPVLAVPSSAAR